MNRAILSTILLLTTATCCRSSYHYPGQFIAAYPVQINCQNCHKDFRGRFNHTRGWCDNHFASKRFNEDVCSKCHGEVQCVNCHRDPRTNETIWSQIKQDRWKRKIKE